MLKCIFSGDNFISPSDTFKGKFDKSFKEALAFFKFITPFNLLFFMLILKASEPLGETSGLIKSEPFGIIKSELMILKISATKNLSDLASIFIPS